MNVVDPSVVCGERVEIGHFTVIEANVKIGNDVKIGHRVTIHEGTVVGDGVTIADGAVLGKPPLPGLAVIGDFTIGGTLTGVEELANVLQVCLDAGAKRVLLPMSSASDLATVPPELMVKFDLIFYDAPEAAVFKALGAN